MKTSVFPPDTLSTEEIPTPTRHQQSPASRSIPSLYVLKAICAFFVVVQHIHLAFCRHIKPITTTAVLVFFIITGYFLYVKAREKGERSVLAHLFKHALIITVVVNVIAFIYHYLVMGNVEELLRLTPIKFIVIHRSGIYYSYWYLRTLCVSLFILYLLYRFVPCKVMDWIMSYLPILFVGSVMMGSYCSILNISPHQGYLYHNALVVGIPCIATGYLIAKHEQTLICSCWASVGCLLLLAFGSCVERKVAAILFSPMGNEYWFLTLPLAASMVLVCLKYRAWGPHSLVNIGKYHSANIYYLHVGVLETLRLYSPALLAFPVVQELQALLVFLLCIPLSMGINLVSHRLTAILSRNKPQKSPQTE